MKKIYKKEKEQGIMLIEVLLALALLSMVLSTAYSFYFLGVKSYQEGSSHIDNQQNVRISADKINRELKWARNYTIFSGGSQIEFYFFNDNRRYSFRVRGGDLEFLIGTTVTKVACNIESVQFSTLEPDLIKFTVTARGEEKKYDLSTFVYLRNVR